MQIDSSSTPAAAAAGDAADACYVCSGLACGVHDEGEEELDPEVLEAIRNWGVNDIVKCWGGFAAQMSEQLLLLQREQETAAAAAAAAADGVKIKQEPTDGSDEDAAAAAVADAAAAAAGAIARGSGSSSSSAVEQQLGELVRQHLVHCKAVAALNPGARFLMFCCRMLLFCWLFSKLDLCAGEAASGALQGSGGTQPRCERYFGLSAELSAVLLDALQGACMCCKVLVCPANCLYVLQAACVCCK
jgi:predicted regulator of Ras-like GTPase activity (Roadblock/LC7/MglB family)